MRAEYLREAIALLKRAQQTEDPREASELLKQAADITALVAKLSVPDTPNVKVHYYHSPSGHRDTNGETK